MLKKNPKYSKRINYEALDDIFKSAGGQAAADDDKGDDELYTFDDKSDGEAMVVVEESGPAQPLGEDLTSQLLAADEDEGSDKGEDYTAWDDTYEQEV